jgi:hypothetical protein
MHINATRHFRAELTHFRLRRLFPGIYTLLFVSPCLCVSVVEVLRSVPLPGGFLGMS